MFPRYEAREMMEPADAPEATAEPTAEPVEITDMSTSTVLPDLSEDAADGQAASADGASTDGAANIG